MATALGSGTMIGWKRIVVTVGEKIGKTHLTYAQGASAELVAMTTIGLADFGGLPVSTTQVLSAGVAGTMAANATGLQWSTVRNIALAWVLTLPRLHDPLGRALSVVPDAWRVEPRRLAITESRNKEGSRSTMVPLRIKAPDWVRKADEAPHRSTSFLHASLHQRPGLWGDDPERSHERRLASGRGTEASGKPSAPVGLSRPIDWLAGRMGGNGRHEASLTEHALARLAQVSGLRIVGSAQDRGGVFSFTLQGAHAHDVATLLDRNGIAVRAGNHCAEPLMRRLGLDSTARASFGIYTTHAEIDALADTLERISGFFAASGAA